MLTSTPRKSPFNQARRRRQGHRPPLRPPRRADRPARRRALHGGRRLLPLRRLRLLVSGTLANRDRDESDARVGRRAGDDGLAGQHLKPALPALRLAAGDRGAQRVRLPSPVGLRTSRRPDNAAQPYLRQLNVGVPVFFLISGFLLYRPFARTRYAGDRSPATLPYAERRGLRIFPAYWVALVGVVVLVGKSGEAATATPVFSVHGALTYFPLLQAYDSEHASRRHQRRLDTVRGVELLRDAASLGDAAAPSAL